jgi:hypothetical protein
VSFSSDTKEGASNVFQGLRVAYHSNFRHLVNPSLCRKAHQEKGSATIVSEGARDMIYYYTPVLEHA